jgi:anti-sigma factor RsiW
MRGQISDQDLTDYALDELHPEERLYVESMLAVSEECRNDVYEMIEMGQMLDEGFEAEEEMAPALLTDEQRQKLVQFRSRVPVWQRAVALAGMAACAALAAAHPAFWRVENPRSRVVQASKMVADAVAPANVNLANSISNLRALADDTTSWFPTAAEVCTPPSWLENSQVTTLGDMTQ